MNWEELKEKAKEMGAAMWANGKTFGIFDNTERIITFILV